VKFLYLKFKNKLKEKFNNHEGEFQIELVISYFFSKDILNIPIRILNIVRKRIDLLNGVKSSSLKKFNDLLLPVSNTDKINFKQEETPYVSIIIPVYNQVNYTINCLNSLYNNIGTKFSFEIIIINDNSTDRTLSALQKYFSGIQIITNEANMGFVLSCNKGAEFSKGKYVCFLNNDTYVQKEWLEQLVDLMESDDSIGLVGSMLIYPNGVLQEAGGIIWQDGSGYNYGRNENRFSPKYNYIREVDYISGASILLTKRDFDRLGGFDERYVPAYYEDTDLCFSVRHILNKKVVYTPFSRVIHYEGITSGKDVSSGVKKNQVINSGKFLLKWKDTLDTFYLKNNPHNSDNIEKAILKYYDKSIIVIDSYVPCYNRESGSNRLYQILKIIRNLNYHITFVPDNRNGEQPYTNELQVSGIKVLYNTRYFYDSFKKQIQETVIYTDIAWICRPELFAKYFPLISINDKIRIIYDTIDLHFLRLEREKELFPKKRNNVKKVKKMELAAVNIADTTIAISDVDEEILHGYKARNVVVIPNVHNLKYRVLKKDFKERKNILFIGSYKHTPNIDAVLWLIKEIMPIVWRVDPEIKVTLLGSKTTKAVENLASDKVFVPGFINDVSFYFNSHRLFVAPLRYGAGMKGKIGQSLEYGLPIVSTSIGVEGMYMRDHESVLVADDALSFAKSIIELYNDETLWNLIQDEGEKAIMPFTELEIKEKIKKVLGGFRNV
jgi:GT2 family glycosyltransferase